MMSRRFAHWTTNWLEWERIFFFCLLTMWTFDLWMEFDWRRWRVSVDADTSSAQINIRYAWGKIFQSSISMIYHCLGEKKSSLCKSWSFSLSMEEKMPVAWQDEIVAFDHWNVVQLEDWLMICLCRCSTERKWLNKGKITSDRETFLLRFPFEQEEESLLWVLFFNWSEDLLAFID